MQHHTTFLAISSIVFPTILTTNTKSAASSPFNAIRSKTRLFSNYAKSLAIGGISSSDKVTTHNIKNIEFVTLKINYLSKRTESLKHCLQQIADSITG